MKAAKKVKLSDEARYAIRHCPPTDTELIRWLNGNEVRFMPTSADARWVAYFLLALRGYEFEVTK